ncbi:MAG: DUF1553 domain-containing protein [Gemmataceae bacterium]|nr:DUF1553 domain-containing protein [Gemmataceae bacterium]
MKRLTAEQLADALDDVTGTREKYAGLPLGTRAIQLPDAEVKSYLMDTFGRPPRQVLCECERTTKPNIAQAMHLFDGDFPTKKIADKDGRVEKLIAAKAPLSAAVEELFLAAWGRPPTRDVLAKAGGWARRPRACARACRACCGCSRTAASSCSTGDRPDAVFPEPRRGGRP